MKRKLILMRRVFLLLIFVVANHLGQSQVLQKMDPDALVAYITNSEKPLVVSFWATWCASCNEEIPYFIKTIKEKYKDSVGILLVSLDVKSYYPQKITAFADKRNYNVPLAWMSETNADIFCPKIDPKWSGAIPSTLMVNNKIQYRKFYERGLSPLQFEQSIRELVGL